MKKFIIEREVTQARVLDREQVVELFKRNNVVLGDSVGCTIEELDDGMLETLLDAAIYHCQPGLIDDVEGLLDAASPDHEYNINVRIEDF